MDKHKCFSKIKQKLLKLTICIFCIAQIRSNIFAATITPDSNQYLAFRILNIQNVDGKDKQVTAELWAYNLEFTSIDLNIYYDSTKLKPSDPTTNDYITSDDATDQNMFIKSDDVKDNLDVWFMKYEPTWLQYLFSVLSNKSSSYTYIGTNANGDKYTSIKAGTEGLKLGTYTYRLYNGKIDNTTFKLQSTQNQSTGIQVVKDNLDSYTDPSIFRITLEYQSANAYLKDLQVDDITVDSFDKATLNYTQKYLKNNDNITILPTAENAASKIKVQKQVDDNKYEDIAVNDSDGKYSIKLNDLGNDTIINVVVTAEDEDTINTYQLDIKRPCTIIKGSVQLGEDLRESMQRTYGIYVKYNADISIYDSNKFNWDGIRSGENTLDQSDLLEKVSQTASDDEGNYELKVIPGTYDLKIERPGFLVVIIKNVEAIENQTITLDKYILYEGDPDRTSVIDLNDIIDIVQNFDISSTDNGYDPKYDFGQSNSIDMDDLVSVVQNIDKTVQIYNYKK